jgi:hypothetical protein
VPAVFELSGDWSKLGLEGDPLPGDPQVLQQIIDDFTYLRDTAWSMAQGLDAFVASASSGGFEGATADVLREVISGRLKTFLYNIARAFSLAGEAVAEYRLVLVDAQQTVTDAYEGTAGLAAGDPKLAGVKRQVQGQLDQVSAAARRMEAALRDAAEMVSQPVKVPSLFERVWKGLELGLEFAAMALGFAAMLFGGPLGVLAWGAGLAVLGMTAVDFAWEHTNWLGLGMGLLGIIAPELRGFFSLRSLAAGMRGLFAGEGGVLWHTAGELLQLARRGLQALPWVVVRTPGWIGDGVRWVGGVLGRDFDEVVARYPKLVAAVGPHAAYALVTGGRVVGALFTPMTFHDMATLGFRGAWRVMRERASLTGAVRDLRAGWSGYRRLSAAGAEAGLLHGAVGADWHAEDASLHEPLLAPVLPEMGVERMLALRDLPPEVFQRLYVQAYGLMRRFMRMPLVVGQDAGDVALRNEQLVMLAPVMEALYRGKKGEAEGLARAIAKERGGLPWQGLAGGGQMREIVPGEASGEASSSGLGVPDPVGAGAAPRLDGSGAVPQGGERAELASALWPGEPSVVREGFDPNRAPDGFPVPEPGTGGQAPVPPLTPEQLALVRARVRVLVRGDLVTALSPSLSPADVNRLIAGELPYTRDLVEWLTGLVGGMALSWGHTANGLVVSTGAGEFLHLNSEGEFVFRTLRLPGRPDLHLRFDTEGVVRPNRVQLADDASRPVQVPGAAIHGTAEGGLTVRVPVSRTGEAAEWAEWHISSLGVLVSREVPVTVPGVSSGLRVRVVYVYGAEPDEVTPLHGVLHAHPSDSVEGFDVEPLRGESAARLPGGFLLTGPGEGHRFLLDALGRVAPPNLGQLPREQLAARPRLAAAPVPRDAESGPVQLPTMPGFAVPEEARVRLVALSRDETAMQFARELVAGWGGAGNSGENALRLVELVELVVPVPLVPVAGEPLDALRGVTVWQIRVPPTGSGTGPRRVVLGPSDVTIAPLEGALAGELGDGFTLVSATTGGRFHVRMEGDGRGRVVYADWLLMGVGTLRVPMGDPAAAAPRLLNAVGWQSDWLAGGRVSVTNLLICQSLVVDLRTGVVLDLFVPVVPVVPCERAGEFWRLDFAARKAVRQEGVGAGVELDLPGGLPRLVADGVLWGSAREVAMQALTPVEGVSVMRLRGVDSLRDVHVMRIPAAPGRPGSLRLQLDAGRLLHLRGEEQALWREIWEREVVFREGGGVSVLGGAEGTLHFAVDGAFVSRTVGIGGTDRVLRFSRPRGTDPDVLIDVARDDGTPMVVAPEAVLDLMSTPAHPGAGHQDALAPTEITVQEEPLAFAAMPVLPNDEVRPEPVAADERLPEPVETVSPERNAPSPTETPIPSQDPVEAQGRLRIALRAHCPGADILSQLGMEPGTVADYVVRGTQCPHNDLVRQLERLFPDVKVPLDSRVGGGFVADTGAGERLHLAGDGRLDFQLLRLPGIERWLRFDHERSGPPGPARLVRQNGEPVGGTHAGDVTRSGMLDVTVRLLVPGTQEQAEWYVDWAHVLRSRTVPVVIPKELAVPPGLRVRIDYSYRPVVTDAVTRSYTVIDESGHRADGFAAERLPPEWAAAGPEDFTLIQMDAGRIRMFHLDGLGRDSVGGPVEIREAALTNPTDTGASSQLGPRVPSCQDLLRSGWDAQAGESSRGSALMEISAPGLPSSSVTPVSPRASGISTAAGDKVRVDLPGTQSETDRLPVPATPDEEVVVAGRSEDDGPTPMELTDPEPGHDSMPDPEPPSSVAPPTSPDGRGAESGREEATPPRRRGKRLLKDLLAPQNPAVARAGPRTSEGDVGAHLEPVRDSDVSSGAGSDADWAPGSDADCDVGSDADWDVGSSAGSAPVPRPGRAVSAERSSTAIAPRHAGSGSGRTMVQRLAALEDLRTRIVVLYRSGVGGGSGRKFTEEFSKVLERPIDRSVVRSALAAENTRQLAEFLSGRVTGTTVVANSRVDNRGDSMWEVADWVVPVPLVSVAGGQLDALRGATVWKVRVPQADSGTHQRWQWQVMGVSDVTLAPLKSASADELGDRFTLVSATTGGRFQVRVEEDGRGRVVFVDWKLDGLGRLRVPVEGPPAAPRLLDSAGRAAAGWAAAWSQDRRVVELQDMSAGQTVVVDAHTGRVVEQIVPGVGSGSSWRLDFAARKASRRGDRPGRGLDLSDDGLQQLVDDGVLAGSARRVAKQALAPLADGAPVLRLRGVDWLKEAAVVRVPAAPGKAGFLSLGRRFPDTFTDQGEFIIRQQGNATKAAVVLGCSGETLLKKLKRYRGLNEAPSTESLRRKVPEEARRRWQELPELPEREVAFREGGGVSILGSPEGTLHFTVDGIFAFRTARIRGTELALRFSTPKGTDADVSIHMAARDGRPVEVKNDLNHRKDGLTLRMPLPGVDWAWAEWRYNKDGAPLAFEMPLLVEGEPLEVGVRVEEGRAGGEPRYAVLDPDTGTVAKGFKASPVVAELAKELPEGFTVTETKSGQAWHFPAVGEARYVDKPGVKGVRRRQLDPGLAPPPREDRDVASTSSPMTAGVEQPAEGSRGGAPDGTGDATDLPHGVGIPALPWTTLPGRDIRRPRKRRR